MLTGPSTTVLARDDNQNTHYGVNYASADYLGLAQHPDAKKAAIAALKKYGVSAGNSPSNLGQHE
jgi:7-keto-8-aminopelargonate synthetase-like enzyme